MGELNFCLGPSDSVLSGPSLLKDLNTATNKMVKNLLILNSPGQPVSQSASQPASQLVDRSKSTQPKHGHGATIYSTARLPSSFPAVCTPLSPTTSFRRS